MVVAGIAILAASGCDFLYGVNRHTRLPTAPDFECVGQVIRRAPGVDDVEYRRTAGGRPLTWTGLKPPTDVHTYLYRDGEILAALQVTIEYDGRTDFSQHLLDINRKPPQSQIDASRPVMHWIEEQLETECGITGLASAIEEWCKGVECPPLSR